LGHVNHRDDACVCALWTCFYNCCRFEYGYFNVDDLMVGEGLFLGPSVASYGLDHDHTTSFISWDGSNVLR
jgi:hypothetical protein